QLPHKPCSLHLCCCWQLSMVVKPGESLSITCKVFGYSISDDSCTTDWIRHPVDKAMEWIDDSDGNCKDSLKSRFSISKDDCNNIVILEGQKSQTEDTAVYYCCCYGVYHCDYTGATVILHPTTAPPSLHTLMNCGTATNNIYGIGCIATGFSPSSLTFKWKDASGSAYFVQYPAVQSGVAYTGVSQQGQVQLCGAAPGTNHHQDDLQDRSVHRSRLVKKVFLDNQAVLDCVITATDLDTVSGTNITWQVNEQAKTDDVDLKPIESKGNLNSRVSTLTINQMEWTNVNKVQCSAMKSGEVTSVIQELSFTKGSRSLRHLNVVVISGHIVQVLEREAPDVQTFAPNTNTHMNTYTRKHADTHTNTHTRRHKCMSVPHHLSLSLFSANILLTEPEAGFALSCTDNDEDEFSSLWSTTSSFIILVLLSLTYSTVLSLVKMKQ
uniref:Ig-like domain-containing protein n=1 Tax=Hucho hucho TaxID=62062 RepID=A0A4W5PBA3_9TELE